MTILRSVLSWIVYGIGGAFLSEQWAATAAAVAAVFVLGLARGSGRRGDELVIEGASAVFFVGYAVVAWATGGSPDVARWVGPISQFWLAAAVLVGLMRRQPFTLALAKHEAPVEVQGTPWFFDFNVKLTRAWLVSFLVSGIVLLVAVLLHLSSIWLSVVCIVAAIVCPTLYTRRLVAAQG